MTVVECSQITERKIWGRTIVFKVHRQIKRKVCNKTKVCEIYTQMKRKVCNKTLVLEGSQINERKVCDKKVVMVCSEIDERFVAAEINQQKMARDVQQEIREPRIAPLLADEKVKKKEGQRLTK